MALGVIGAGFARTATESDKRGLEIADFGPSFPPPFVAASLQSRRPGSDRMLKLCLSGILAALSLLLPVEPAHGEQILRIGYWNIPPHVVDAEGGRPRGAAISFFDEYIAPELDMTVVWDAQATPPTRLMEQLREGTKDAMIFLGKTKERAEYLHYPQPYLDIPQTLVLLTSHPIERIADISQIYGLRVGFLTGGRLPEKLRDERIHYDLIAGERLFQRNVEKLLLGRIDAIYAPLTIAVKNIIEQMEVGDQVKMVPIEFLEPVLIYTVFSKKTVSSAVVEKYNEALAAAVRVRKYKDFVERYEARTNPP